MVEHVAIVGLSALVTFSVAVGSGSTHHLAALALRAVIALLIPLLVFQAARLPTNRSVALAIVLSCSVLTLGLLWSERLVVGLDYWATFTGACALFIAASTATTETVERIFGGVALAAVAQSLWAIGEFLWTGERASAGFFNPNNLGAWLVLMGTAAALRGHRTGIVVAASCALGVVATGSRSALLALFAVAFVLTLQRSRRLAVGAVLTSLTIGAALPSIRGRFLGATDAYAFDRLTIWSTALRAGWQELWGWGLGDARTAFRMVGVPLSHGEVRYARVATQAHNEWLQLWVELGLLGVVVCCLFLVAAVALLEARSSRYGGVALLAAIVIPAFFGASLRVPLIALSAALVLGRHASGTGDFALQRRHRVALTVAAALVVGVTAPASLSRLAREHAAALRDAGQLEDSIHWSSLALGLAPHDLSSHLLDASLEFRVSGDADAALSRLGGIAARFPGSPDPADRANILLAQLSSTPARDAIGLAVAERRTELEPNNALRWVSYADALAANDQSAVAQEVLRHAVKLEPNCAGALLRLARMEPDPNSRALLAGHALHANARAGGYTGYPAAVLSLPAKLQEIAKSLVAQDFSIPQTQLNIEPL